LAARLRKLGTGGTHGGERGESSPAPFERTELNQLSLNPVSLTMNRESGIGNRELGIGDTGIRGSKKTRLHRCKAGFDYSWVARISDY
jgi:hypothetical protein